jgi:cytochrome c553
MKRMLLIAALAGLFAAMSAAQAGGDPAAGKAKANGCAGCHGVNGEGKDPYPALAGKPEAQLAQDLMEYKSGKRKNAIMHTFAAKLSDQDIANLAAYYASLKGK